MSASTMPDDDADLIRRRRKRQREQSRRRMLAVGAAAAVVVTALLCGGVALSRRQGGADATAGAGRPLVGGPSASSEGETWDHAELAAYLRSRGVPVNSTATDLGIAYGPACDFRRTNDRTEPEVFVQKWPTIQAAKDRAGGSPQPAFAWGRFVFRGEPGTERYVAAMRAALGAN